MAAKFLVFLWKKALVPLVVYDGVTLALTIVDFPKFSLEDRETHPRFPWLSLGGVLDFIQTIAELGPSRRARSVG